MSNSRPLPYKLDSIPTHSQYQGMKHFGALEGMRAVGVILVILEHYGGGGLKWLSGWLGVHIFFVISGFLITTLLLREYDRRGQVSLGNFYIRRIFRITPVYYLILAITIVQTFTLGGESWDQLRQSLLYYVFFLNEQNFVAPWKLTWTMGIEWKFYMVWPVLLFFLPSGYKKMVVTILCTLMLLIWFWSSPIVKAPHYIVLVSGAICAFLLHHPRTYKLLRYLITPQASIVMLLVVIAMQTYFIHNIPIPEGAYGGALGIVIYGCVIAVFVPTLFATGPVNRLLKSSVFQFIGQRSYSLYLIQILAWQAVVGMVPSMRVSLVGAILTVIVGCIFSDFLYRYVERPMVSFGRKVVSQRKATKS